MKGLPCPLVHGHAFPQTSIVIAHVTWLSWATDTPDLVRGGRGMWQDSSWASLWLCSCLPDHPLLAGRRLDCPLSYLGSSSVLALRSKVITIRADEVVRVDNSRALTLCRVANSAQTQSRKQRQVRSVDEALSISPWMSKWCGFSVGSMICLYQIHREQRIWSTSRAGLLVKVFSHQHSPFLRITFSPWVKELHLWDLLRLLRALEKCSSTTLLMSPWK